MGTEISVLAPLEGVEQAGSVVRALFGEWESALSRFRPESELSRLNARTGGPIAVSPLLYDVVASALAAARVTRGAFDPTLLPDLVDRKSTRLNSSHRRLSRMPSSA